MRRAILFITLTVFAVVLLNSACTHKPQVQPVVVTAGYPDSVAKILINQCATAGCHNQASYQLAAGLLLDSYDHLMAGSNFGAEVVAYSTRFSRLLAYCNKYDTSDATVTDPGHITTYPTLQQYNTIKNWIAKGAPDANGTIPFAANPATRQKIYLALGSTCNQVAVIDAQSKLVMRYITVGNAQNQVPHDVDVSSDGLYAYVSIYDGNWLQKIDTRTDTVVGTVDLSSLVPSAAEGQWSIINLSPMDTALMVSGWLQAGNIATVNTGSMTINTGQCADAQNGLGGAIGSFELPHGIASNATFDTFFAALQYGNVVNKFQFKSPPFVKQVSVKGSTPKIASQDSTEPGPHQIQMSPDHSRYFVTCQFTNEVRVMDAYTDKLIDSIPVGMFPQEMALSLSKGYLFVVCQNDNTNPTGIGSIYVINYNTMAVVGIMYGVLSHPHDVAVDEQDGLVFVCSTNLDGAVHHLGYCGGADGWYTVYNLNTLQPADNKIYEVLANPYTLSARFK